MADNVPRYLSQFQDYVQIGAAMGLVHVVHSLILRCLLHQKKAREKTFYIVFGAYPLALIVLLILHEVAVLGTAEYRRATSALFIGLYVYDVLMLITNWERLNPTFRVFFAVHHSAALMLIGTWIVVWGAQLCDDMIYNAIIIWLSQEVPISISMLIRLFINPSWWHHMNLVVSMFGIIGVSWTCYVYGMIACQNSCEGCWYPAHIHIMVIGLFMNCVDLAFVVRGYARFRRTLRRLRKFRNSSKRLSVQIVQAESKFDYQPAQHALIKAVSAPIP